MNPRRVALGLVALVAAVVVVLTVRSAGLPDVRGAVEASGVWAPLLFVLFSGAVTVTPVPRTVFTVAAGVLFGSVTGVLLAVAGTTLAAAAAFWLVRLLGATFVERHAHRRGVTWVRARLDRSGLLAVLSLRLIPMVPFAVLNYAAGLSGVRFVPYVLGTVLGILPGTVAVVVLGDAVTGGSPHPVLLTVSLVCGLLGIGGALLAARRPAVAVTAD
ncbi:TVP38/TMEM64 family protein [Pseudonocardia abyssalis]|uniref:TVP38/TMEM64 family membrane protein n=2 Tax=Pseudonocardia abyssalis TaxID=2792008 RepID=A0ABS6UVD7_9PSEU|nr:TVP38/TMEM64 family protein [Pseudonocardia abyssalis]MBW0136209.1 TVP38/TMEM64 family protein [Pseudonocardia abyssalis]